MIGFLSGNLAARTPDGCFLDVGGVGYRLICSATTVATLPDTGARCRLWTHLHVREDALTLYGFASESEQTMFEGLLGVSGVGPRVALMVCSAFAPDAFRRLLVTDDAASIASVPGIGNKTAQRILLDLKDRFALPDLEVAGSHPDALARARSALENLGYSPVEVRAALTEAGDDEPVEAVIRSALKVLG
ncbi:MAG: Holliday junction branch migration protein RuvA [Actinomycetota bacterium]